MSSKKKDSLVHPCILSLELYSWTLQSPFIPSLMVNTYNLQRLVQQMMNKTQLEEEIFFPLIQECQIRCLLGYFSSKHLYVCVCVNLKKRLSIKIRNLYFLTLDKFTTFPLFITIFEAYKVS